MSPPRPLIIPHPYTAFSRNIKNSSLPKRHSIIPLELFIRVAEASFGAKAAFYFLKKAKQRKGNAKPLRYLVHAGALS